MRAQVPREGVPADRPQRASVRADLFEIAYQLDGTDLLLSIDTDLPDSGELSVTVSRA